MAEDLVSQERIDAGREYLRALASLGFEPEGALWSIREDEPQSLELSLFTSVVDRVGPRAVLDALFQAYDKALTPRRFDPWDVSVYSPGMHFYECVKAHSVPLSASLHHLFQMGSRTTLFDPDNRLIGFGHESATRLCKGSWVYRMPGPGRRSAIPQLRAWNRFEERIAAAA